MSPLDLAAHYVGKQETFGPNDGPILRTIRADLNLPESPASWCASFVGWILAKSFAPPGTPLKAWLRDQLGFDSPFYVDSCRDWLTQAMRSGMSGHKPEAGDLFILINEHGIAHHMGFVADPVALDGFGTIEGNTNEGGSANGDGVYRRARPMRTSVRFIRLPDSLRWVAP
jgi:hypothetical protein